MTISKLPMLILIIYLLSAVYCSQQCIQFLQQLQKQSISNRSEFIHKMMPFLVLSGKSIDDLGFPGSCEKDIHNYKYSTVQITIQTNTTQYTGYLGFCFTSMCPVQDLNQYAEFIIDFIFAEYVYDGVNGVFIQPPLQLQFSPAALIICLVFVILLGITMTYPIQTWISLCKSDQDQQYVIKSVYIDLQNPNMQLDQQRITTQSTLLQRLSLKYKWKQLWKQEQSYKIWEFSLFRVLAVPMLLYGQIFWLTNFGAFNYYAFYQEIYDQVYVKFAIFAYYMPDIFFFISAFLYTRKIILIKQQDFGQVLRTMGRKILRLYPLYIVVLVIYWGVSPALHAGPIWYVYQQQVAVCNTAWWRVLLMIDNWFAQGCYPALWFVQVEVQLTLVITLFFFTVYIKQRKTSFYLLGAYFIAALVVLCVFSAKMLVSVQIAIDPYTELYYKSFHSHAWFYICGVIFALLSQKQKVRLGLQIAILDKPILSKIIKFLSVGTLLLIMFRPWIWWGSYSLSLQLIFCRIGALLSFIILFLNGMFVHEKNTSVIHKYGYYMYPVVLVSYMVAQSSFWSSGSFMYVSGYDILNEMVPNFIISYALGIFLGLFFDIRTLIIK